MVLPVKEGLISLGKMDLNSYCGVYFWSGRMVKCHDMIY